MLSGGERNDLKCRVRNVEDMKKMNNEDEDDESEDEDVKCSGVDEDEAENGAEQDGPEEVLSEADFEDQDDESDEEEEESDKTDVDDEEDVSDQADNAEEEDESDQTDVAEEEDESDQTDVADEDESDQAEVDEEVDQSDEEDEDGISDKDDEKVSFSNHSASNTSSSSSNSSSDSEYEERPVKKIPNGNGKRKKKPKDDELLWDFRRRRKKRSNSASSSSEASESPSSSMNLLREALERGRHKDVEEVSHLGTRSWKKEAAIVASRCVTNNNETCIKEYKSDRYHSTDTQSILYSFYREKTPYPKKNDFEHLEKATGLTYKRILYWFSNRRRRDGLANSKQKQQPQTSDLREKLQSIRKRKEDMKKPITTEQKAVMAAFYQDRTPYPTKEDFEVLGSETGLPMKRLLYYFSNRRRREGIVNTKKPKIESNEDVKEQKELQAEEDLDNLKTQEDVDDFKTEEDQSQEESVSQGEENQEPISKEHEEILSKFYENVSPYPKRKDFQELIEQTDLSKERLKFYFSRRRRKEGVKNAKKQRNQAREKDAKDDDKSSKAEIVEAHKSAKVEIGTEDVIGSSLNGDFECFLCGKYSSRKRPYLLKHVREIHRVSPKVCKRGCFKVYRKDAYWDHPCLASKMKKAKTKPQETLNKKKEPPTFYSSRYRKLLKKLNNEKGASKNKKECLSESVARSRFLRNGKLELVMVTGEQYQAVLDFLSCDVNYFSNFNLICLLNCLLFTEAPNDACLLRMSGNVASESIGRRREVDFVLRLRQFCPPLVPRLLQRTRQALRGRRVDVRRVQNVPRVRGDAEERGSRDLRVLRRGRPLLVPRPATREAA